jgi:hypothetical protein
MTKYNVGDTLSGRAPLYGRISGKFTGKMASGRHPQVEMTNGTKAFLHAAYPISALRRSPSYSVGDVLRGEATPMGLKTGAFVKTDGTGWHVIADNDGDTWSLNPNRTIAVVKRAEPEAPKLDFVGPEPKPAESPRATTPFKVHQGARRVVVDSLNREILRVNGDELSADEDAKLAALVVRLLNEHFGVK